MSERRRTGETDWTGLERELHAPSAGPPARAPGLYVNADSQKEPAPEVGLIVKQTAAIR